MVALSHTPSFLFSYFFLFQMQLSFLLLLLLSGGILGFRANRCGRDVSTMKKYLGIGADVSIDKLADVLLGPNPFPIRYADVFIGTSKLFNG